MSRKTAQSKYDSKTYQLVAHAYIWRFFLTPVAILALGLGIMANNYQIMTYAAIGLGIVLLCLLIHLIHARSVMCRLCRGTLLVGLKTKIKKKKNTISILGDRNLSAAFGLAFRQRSIRCRHCGEKQVYFGKTQSHSHS